MSNMYIVQAKRSPMGSFQGTLSSLSSPSIASQIIQHFKSSHENYDGVLMGCVLAAGLGQAPARQAALNGGLEYHVGAATINKVCGSGMKSIMLACDQLLLNTAESILAGGMESMSNAPFFLPKARSGYRMGHGEVLDHMMRDGLEDAYPNDPKGPRSSMGIFAEATAEKYGFSRTDQDSFAMHSVEKYKKAHESKHFDTEILPIKISDDNFVSVDEPPSKVKIDKIPQLKPAFKKDGTVTAASSSSIADGAAVVHIVSEAYLKKHSLKPLARIVGYTSHSQEPAWFTTAPVGAIQKLLKQTGWATKDVDLFELNEAFAVVTMAATKELGIDPSKVNIHGGACALGHPIGASGARILVTLLHALHTHKLNKGIASLCIGGGEAVSMAIERV